MDGTYASELVSELGSPSGIVVDNESSKIFWVDYERNRIQSTGLHGGNVTTLAETELVGRGLAMYRKRLYFGNLKTPSEVKSCNKLGGDMKTVGTRDNPVQHLAIVTPHVPQSGRINHCADQKCPGDGICLLTPFSFTCQNF